MFYGIVRSMPRPWGCSSGQAFICCPSHALGEAQTYSSSADLLYSTLYYTTLHYTTLQYTTLHITLHYSTLKLTTLHYRTLHYTTLHYTSLHYTTLYYQCTSNTLNHTLHAPSYTQVRMWIPCNTLYYSSKSGMNRYQYDTVILYNTVILQL